MLLTLVTYCYATGLFASAAIAEQCRRDRALRHLSMGVQFGPDRIRLFRGQNSELVKRCLAFVIRNVFDNRFWKARAASQPDEVAGAQETKFFARWTWAFSQREAEGRFNRAVQSDREAGNDLLPALGHAATARGSFSRSGFESQPR